MVTRREQKAASLQRILDVSSRRLREEGADGAAIARVMKEAGLTHGAFYAHFTGKDELAQAGLKHAIETNHPIWFNRSRRDNETFPARLKRLVRGYLTRKHCDHLATSCAVSALAGDIPRATPGLRRAWNEAFESTIEQIAEGEEKHMDDAIVFFSLCVGSLLLARNVEDPALSDRILKAATRHVDTIQTP